jgi:hypothetical protein
MVCIFYVSDGTQETICDAGFVTVIFLDKIPIINKLIHFCR